MEGSIITTESNMRRSCGRAGHCRSWIECAARFIRLEIPTPEGFDVMVVGNTAGQSECYLIETSRPPLALDTGAHFLGCTFQDRPVGQLQEI